MKIVPFHFTESAVRVMEQNGVVHRFRQVPHGGHGFGLGEYSKADGWLDEAVGLWEDARRG